MKNPGPPKRRNPVAAAAKRGAGGRGGPMRDRAKEQKRGERKHKGRPW